MEGALVAVSLASQKEGGSAYESLKSDVLPSVPDI